MSPVSRCETASSPAATITRLVVGGSIVSTKEGKDSALSLSLSLSREIIPRTEGTRRIVRRPLPGNLDLVGAGCVSSPCRVFETKRSSSNNRIHLPPSYLAEHIRYAHIASSRINVARFSTVAFIALPCWIILTMEEKGRVFLFFYADGLRRKRRKRERNLYLYIGIDELSTSPFPSLSFFEQRIVIEWSLSKIYLLTVCIYSSTGREGNCRWNEDRN